MFYKLTRTTKLPDSIKPAKLGFFQKTPTDPWQKLTIREQRFVAALLLVSHDLPFNYKNTPPLVSIRQTNSFSETQKPKLHFNDDKSNPFFKNKKSNASMSAPSNSSLSAAQLNKVDSLIMKLEAEVNSCWPFPHKNRKIVKIQALEELKRLVAIMPLSTAIEKIDGCPAYYDCRKGQYSTRTDELFEELLASTRSNAMRRTG